jgi:hypothetical protein
MDARKRDSVQQAWLDDWKLRYKQLEDRHRRGGASASGDVNITIARRALKEERKAWLKRRANQHTLIERASHDVTIPTAQYLRPSTASAAATTANGAKRELLDQFGVPISSYGTTAPTPQPNLLAQASSIDRYIASLSGSDVALAESRADIAASLGGVDQIVGGLRSGFALAGMDLRTEKEKQTAMHLSLRTAMRAREERRRNTIAANVANREVLDELRRQEVAIMDRASTDADQRVLDERSALLRAERRESANRKHAEGTRELANRRQGTSIHRATTNRSYTSSALVKSLAGRSSAAYVPGPNDGVEQWWYEQKEIPFTQNHINYKRGLNAALNKQMKPRDY